jgi:hypothetical protein
MAGTLRDVQKEILRRAGNKHTNAARKAMEYLNLNYKFKQRSKIIFLCSKGGIYGNMGSWNF